MSNFSLPQRNLGSKFSLQQLPRFIQILWRLLNSTNCKDLSHIHFDIEDSNAFVITNERKFTHTVLPKFYKLNRFDAFVRQLEAYGFLRSSVGTDVIKYRHKFFCKDKPHLLTKIEKTATSSIRSSSTNPGQMKGKAGSDRNSEIIWQNKRDISLLRKRLDAEESRNERLTNTVEELKKLVMTLQQKILDQATTTTQPCKPTTSTQPCRETRNRFDYNNSYTSRSWGDADDVETIEFHVSSGFNQEATFARAPFAALNGKLTSKAATELMNQGSQFEKVTPQTTNRSSTKRPIEESDCARKRQKVQELGFQRLWMSLAPKI